MGLGTPGGTTLLRQYTIVPGHWPQFLELWERVVVLRRKHGFEVLVAFRDDTENVFTWAVRHHGDIEEAMDGYYKDPDRVALEIIGDHVAAWKVSTVDEITIPGS